MKEKILEILKEIRPEFEFDGVDDFFADGMIDSFDLMTLVSSIGTEFDVKVSGEDVVPENFANIDAIARLVERLKRIDSGKK